MDESPCPAPVGVGDELVDVVDGDDQVIGVATRREMRAGRLRHRTAFVIVRASDGKVLIHRRAENKDVWPGKWDLAAGGVLGQGEAYEDGARRELLEELGIDGVPLRSLGQGAFEDGRVSEIAAIFEVTWDGPVRFADGEVVEARWVTDTELERMLAELPFVPDSVALVVPLVLTDR